MEEINKEQEEFYKDLMNEFYEEQEKFDQILLNKKKEFKKQLKGLINISGLWKWLDENNSWTPEGIVDIIFTDEQKQGYSPHQCVRVERENNYLYMKVSMDEYIKGIKYYYIWQTSNFEDSYFGYLLFELKNGKYFKVSYNC